MSERERDLTEHTATVISGRQRHGRVAASAALLACSMLGLAFASVPLYRIFCQVTGYGGTTQRVIEPSDRVLDRSIIVRFDANVSNTLPWRFEPMQTKLEVKLGANTLAFYRATNTSDRPITGTATFNVAPEAAGAYFNKLECFCFTEQTLKPGETVEMPVSFFVDPDMLKDRSARAISQITLSYTFYPVPDKQANAVGNLPRQPPAPPSADTTIRAKTGPAG